MRLELEKQWNGNQYALGVLGKPGTSAEIITRWIERNGGEAFFEPPDLRNRMKPRWGPHLVVRTGPKVWCYANPGDKIVMLPGATCTVTATDSAGEICKKTIQLFDVQDGNEKLEISVT
jgi:hypothetical protein